MRIGFIGLGIMGSPMASNLADAGHDVVGYSRRPESTDQLVSRGGKRAYSIAEATAGNDIVITMLPDSPDVEAVVLGDDGVLAHAKAGMYLVDMSTVRPQTARDIDVAAQQAGAHALDAPVSGGEKGAIDAALSIMVGGAAADYEAVLPVLNALGKTISHVGPSGSGQTVKAANQLMVGGIIELVSEALSLIEASGVDSAAAISVLAGGLAGSKVLDMKAQNMLARQFAPGFRINLHHKDMGIVLDTAREMGVPLPLGGVVAQLFVAARAQGLGDLDHSGLFASLERMRTPAGS